MGHEFEALSGRTLEAAVAVHKALGPGFLESVYQNAMEIALRHRDIPFDCQKEVTILFENEPVGLHRLDLVVSNEIIVELKAVKAFEDIHYAQVKSYLKATASTLACYSISMLLPWQSNGWFSESNLFVLSFVVLS